MTIDTSFTSGDPMIIPDVPLVKWHLLHQSCVHTVRLASQ